MRGHFSRSLLVRELESNDRNWRDARTIAIGKVSAEIGLNLHSTRIAAVDCYF